MRVCLDAFLREQNYTEKDLLGRGNYAQVFKVRTKNLKKSRIQISFKFIK